MKSVESHLEAHNANLENEKKKDWPRLTTAEII